MDAGMTQVGWVKWNGDEFYGFIYSSPNDKGEPYGQGFMPVYVEKPEGFDPRKD